MSKKLFSFFIFLFFVFYFNQNFVKSDCPSLPMCEDCIFEWNVVPGAQPSSCCTGIGTTSCQGRGTHGNQCHTWRACQCDNWAGGDGTCTKRENKVCAIPTIQINQEKLNNQTRQTILSRMKNQVDTQGLNANNFFEQFLMQAVTQGYNSDVTNLISFQALMSESNPKEQPSHSVLSSFLFSIFQALALALPDVGPAVGWAVGFFGTGQIGISTNSYANYYYESIQWKDFLEVSAIELETDYQLITNGLWNYTLSYWKSKGLPDNIKKSGSKDYKQLETLINAQWDAMPTQIEMFRTMIADFMNSAGSGLAVFCGGGKVQYATTQVSNSNHLSQQMLSNFTGGCIDNQMFKDRQGHSIQQGVFAKGSKGYGPWLAYNPSNFLTIQSGDSINNLGWYCFIEENSSGPLNPRFSITRTAFKNSTTS